MIDKDNQVVQILVRRDGLTEKEAIRQTSLVADHLIDCDDPEQLILDELGLEPGYIVDLVW
jgi:hypothetical protein